MAKMILNGEIVDRDGIKIDLDDRGYQFGDGVYEVIRIYNGRLFTAKEHLDRLFLSANKIGINIPFTKEEIEEQLISLVKENNIKLGTVYMQITRGISPRNHAFPNPEVQIVYVAYTKEVLRPTEVMLNGVTAITVPDVRWLRCDIKSINLLGNILAIQEAKNSGNYEAIQHREGTVSEGSHTNVSIVVNGTVKTHPATNLILNGITRQVMLKLCEENQIPYLEESFTLEELFAADEVFITATTLEVTPVIEIDGKPVSNGKPGAITKELQKLFVNEIEKQCGKLEVTHSL